MCLSIINPEEGWTPSITLKQILLGIQELLDNPCIESPAGQSFTVYRDQPELYKKKVLECVAANTPS